MMMFILEWFLQVVFLLRSCWKLTMSRESRSSVARFVRIVESNRRLVIALCWLFRVNERWNIEKHRLLTLKRLMSRHSLLITALLVYWSVDSIPPNFEMNDDLSAACLLSIGKTNIVRWSDERWGVSFTCSSCDLLRSSYHSCWIGRWERGVSETN